MGYTMITRIGEHEVRYTEWVAFNRKGYPYAVDWTGQNEGDVSEPEGFELYNHTDDLMENFNIAGDASVAVITALRTVLQQCAEFGCTADDPVWALTASAGDAYVVGGLPRFVPAEATYASTTAGAKTELTAPAKKKECDAEYDMDSVLPDGFRWNRYAVGCSVKRNGTCMTDSSFCVEPGYTWFPGESGYCGARDLGIACGCCGPVGFETTTTGNGIITEAPCGLAGYCADHASCVTSCDDPAQCAQHCECDSGYVGDGILGCEEAPPSTPTPENGPRPSGSDDDNDAEDGPDDEDDSSNGPVADDDDTGLPSDDCELYTCAIHCSSGCGWSRAFNRCVAGGDTSPNDRIEGAGTPGAVCSDPCKKVVDRENCGGECGWSVTHAICVTGLISAPFIPRPTPVTPGHNETPAYIWVIIGILGAGTVVGVFTFLRIKSGSAKHYTVVQDNYDAELFMNSTTNPVYSFDGNDVDTPQRNRGRD